MSNVKKSIMYRDAISKISQIKTNAFMYLIKD